ncbi:MAG: translation initiation factor IF-3 C-terminal domain-containing protein [Bacilli bacterium]|jgi:translation initiation factor IF-3
MREIRLRPNIAEHDLQTKIRAVRRLILKDKVKVQVFFKGREYTHIQLGINVLNRVVEETKDVARMDVNKLNQYYVILVGI